jgi:hypothetical protein
MQDLTILIPSCEKFSDIRRGCIASLDRCWPDRQCPLCLITDGPTTQTFSNTTIINGGNAEWSDRLKIALGQVQTPYVMIILDDYFICRKVDTKRIERLLQIVKESGAGYLRMSKTRKEKKKFPADPKIRVIDTSDHRYKANLYIGIWKRDVLLALCDESLNPWQFEVALSKKLDKMGTFCLSTTNVDIKIKDVVRKGAITRDTWKYVHKTGLYTGNRPEQTRKDWWRLRLIDIGKDLTPRRWHKYMKRWMEKHGHHYYSDWENEK